MTTDTQANLKVGDSVTDFNLITTKGEINLSQFMKQALVIYFYPRDNTPGCTQESKDFATHYDIFTNQYQSEILGVSRDSLISHQKFKQKYALPFDLVADTDEVLCHHFAVMKLKNMYGKQRRGIERSTFIFDSFGKLYKIFRNVKVAGHVEAILAEVKKLAEQ